jgi:Zn-dependent protease
MEFLIILVAIIFSVILHEISHGWVAEKLGDPTARLMGRITLNPIPHIDPIGTILIPLLFILPALLTGAPPGAFIAWAKPVPVNYLYLKDGKKDMALVALAGPLTNFAIAGVVAVIFHLLGGNPFLLQIIVINLYLGFFNLLPIPPLDGSKVIGVFLSDELAYKYQSMGQAGMILLILLLFFPIGGISISGILGNIVFSILILLGISV